jgi:DNA-binding response OmpR family regulator
MQFRALLVDDEPSILLTLGLLLRSQGFELQTSDSMKAAKALLAKMQFDLVVTDLSLEHPLAGFEIVRAAKLQPTRPATIVMSGFPELLKEWPEHGADAGLQKPTDLSELLSTIERLLPAHQAARSLG